MPNSSSLQYKSDEFLYGYSQEPSFSGGIPVHIHVGWEFLFVKEGVLTYNVDGNVFDVTPGSLIISRPGEIHALYVKAPIHYERHSIIIAGELLNKSIIRYLPPTLHILDISNNPIIPNLFEKMHFYLSNLQGEYLDTAFRSLINELWINIHIHVPSPSDPVAVSVHPIVNKATEFIKAHILEPLTVKQVSDALFITTSYLHQCFGKYMNVTPKQYIMLQKLQLAQQALMNADNPTKVCREFGFRNYSTFFRNYQKVYGHRPSESPKQSLQKIEL